MLALWVVVAIVAHFGYGPGVREWVEIPTVLVVWFLALCTWAIADAGWLSAPRWWASVLDRLKGFFAEYRIQTGIDFGGSPQYENKLPPALVRLSGLLVLSIATGVLWRDAFPGPVRARLLEWSGALYVA